ncbi:hypothetical protein ACFQUU_07815 [Herbaspirillum sp. GCM10030257]|uniref:hypothetical protein n=1 Tax=Herbaspirillum sp. GCM10030257 TaxID=3273393 RepID=UPI00360B086E
MTGKAQEESIALLLMTSATQAGGKRRDVMVRYGLGLVLDLTKPILPNLWTNKQYFSLPARASTWLPIHALPSPPSLHPLIKREDHGGPKTLGSINSCFMAL